MSLRTNIEISKKKLRQLPIFFCLLVCISFVLFFSLDSHAQLNRIPASYSNIGRDEQGIFFQTDSLKYYAEPQKPRYTLPQLMGNPKGTDLGLLMDFGDFDGTITYGLIPYNQVKHPLPIFRLTKDIVGGKVEINIKNDFRYPYDFVGWKDASMLTLGYRLQNKSGIIIFDGEVSVTGTGPFQIAPAIFEGPFISNITDTKVVIWFKTSIDVLGSVEVNGKKLIDTIPSLHHSYLIENLKPDKRYTYKVKYAGFSQQYECKTASKGGS